MNLIHIQVFDEVSAIRELLHNDMLHGANDDPDIVGNVPIETANVDALVRERLFLLDAVNEVLSRRVMDNYSDFVNGKTNVLEHNGLLYHNYKF